MWVWQPRWREWSHLTLSWFPPPFMSLHVLSRSRRYPLACGWDAEGFNVPTMWTHPHLHETIKATAQRNVVYKVANSQEGVEVRFELGGSHTHAWLSPKRAGVFFPCEAKLRRSCPNSNHMVLVRKLNQSMLCVRMRREGWTTQRWYLMTWDKNALNDTGKSLKLVTWHAAVCIPHPMR